MAERSNSSPTAIVAAEMRRTTWGSWVRALRLSSWKRGGELRQMMTSASDSRKNVSDRPNLGVAAFDILVDDKDCVAHSLVGRAGCRRADRQGPDVAGRTEHVEATALDRGHIALEDRWQISPMAGSL
jgi:hypothetical protein